MTDPDDPFFQRGKKVSTVYTTIAEARKLVNGIPRNNQPGPASPKQSRSPASLRNPARPYTPNDSQRTMFSSPISYGSRPQTAAVRDISSSNLLETLSRPSSANPQLDPIPTPSTSPPRHKNTSQKESLVIQGDDNSNDNKKKEDAEEVNPEWETMKKVLMKLKEDRNSDSEALEWLNKLWEILQGSDVDYSKRRTQLLRIISKYFDSSSADVVLALCRIILKVITDNYCCQS